MRKVFPISPCLFMFFSFSVLGFPAAGYADSTSSKRKVNFPRDIQPILKAHCLKCHGEKRPRGGLKLTNREGVLQEADSGKFPVVPGKIEESEIIRRVVTSDKDERMPPRGTPLTGKQIQKLKNWIKDGAHWEGEKHWAYVKPRRPELPPIQNKEWARNAIDHFVLTRLEAEQIHPSPEAEKARLLRRVYLDLIGLPPTVKQVDAFLQNNRPDAYERIVDQLLASPHYGERWARSWLDQARYADSNGFQRDGFRTVWPYRDYVINAFNKGMPFDQFTIEQIAGDLLPNATLQQKIATAFNRCTTVNVEAGVDREEDRVNAIFDRVTTTSTVWLGTTMVCAQCHEHKYDPFDQKDFYQLFAYFNNTPMETQKGSGASRNFNGPKITIPLDPEEEMKRKELQKERAAIARGLKELEKEVTAQQSTWEKEILADKEKLQKLPKEIRKILRLKKRNRGHKKKLTSYFTNLNPEIKKLRGQISSLDKEIKKLEPPTCLVMVEREEPRQTTIFRRGNFLEKLEEVEPAVPSVLHPLPEDAPKNRLGLARWLASPENPLTPRVMVNRWWAEFFGEGIVTTLEDFGTQCDPPSHPKLLDWLATEFVRSGWSMKHVHKLMVTSATYRQSSRISTEQLKGDPKNRLLARGPRFRLSAEMIRDNALAVSGLLSKKMGGPPVFPPQPAGVWNVIGRVDNTYRTSKGQDRYRRGIYTIWRRSSPYPSFVAFDAPARSACVVKRPRTNTPLQAITLMNDPVFVEAAIALGQRMRNDLSKADLRDRLTYGFRLCLAREPSDRELDVLENIYRRAHRRYQKSPTDATRLLQIAPQYRKENQVELASWFQVATVLLNLDETITKG